MPTVEMVLKLEQCVPEGKTVFVQIYSELFCLAIMCSCRGSGCQRIQKPYQTKDALTGQSRMENHRKCVQGAIPLIGLSGIDWITPWIKALTKASLPGIDFRTLGLAKGGVPNGVNHPTSPMISR